MVPECRHIKTSGGKCGSPALRGKPYCYFHSRLKQRAARPASPYLAIELPAALEDRGAIQLALSEIVTAVADHRIDTKRAGILLYALQIASSNAKHQDEIVCADSVDETVLTEQGEEMALEGAKAGPPEEESLASLLIKEVRRLNQQNQDFSPDHTPQPDENEDFDPEGEGRGYQRGYPLGYPLPSKCCGCPFKPSFALSGKPAIRVPAAYGVTGCGAFFGVEIYPITWFLFTVFTTSSKSILSLPV